MAKLLSVIVPSYNVEQYLKKTVESFLKCKTLSEIELIIVSDGSTDKTVEIANKYKKSILRLSLLLIKRMEVMAQQSIVD
ncbi:glycosyltransferase family 2 protein [Bacteroides fragilis]